MPTKRPWPTSGVLAEIGTERRRQDKKWGEQNHPDGTGGQPLRLTEVNLDLRTGEELALIFRARCQRLSAAGEVTWRDVLLEEVFEALAETDRERLRTELIQIAAVAVQWVEAIERRTDRSGS